jgi:hypothetical protein
MQIWLALLAISAAAILLVVLLAGPEEVPDAEAGRGEEPRAEQEAARVEGGEEPAAQSKEWRALLESVLQKIEAERERAAAAGARSRTAVEGATDGTAPGSRGGGRGDLDEAVLLEAGSSADDVAWLRERVGAAEKKRRALLASAGRSASPESREALRELEAELEREIGSEDYDRVLHAAGETNRVRVRFPMERSPGADAGLEPGDVVLVYNGHTIYRTEDLHALARNAPPKTEIPIVLRRDGRDLHAEIRSGPLGTFFEEFRERPQ